MNFNNISRHTVNFNNQCLKLAKPKAKGQCFGSCNVAFPSGFSCCQRLSEVYFQSLRWGYPTGSVTVDQFQGEYFRSR